MSNVNAGFGFRPIRSLGGYAVTGASDVYQIDPTNTVKIYAGDPVNINASGYINVAVSTDNPVLPIAIFSGCTYYDTVQRKPIWSPYWTGASSATGTVFATVVSDTKTVFEVQSTGAAITYAAVGANANFVAGTGNAYSGISGATLSTTTATTNTLPFRIVGLSTKVGVDAASSYNIVEVVFNDSFFNQLTGV